LKVKAIEFSVSAAISYWAGRRYSKSRRFIGVCQMVAGGIFTGLAVRNHLRKK
jgi:threonine/homoserine/homoserine lactone efflux protein